MVMSMNASNSMDEKSLVSINPFTLEELANYPYANAGEISSKIGELKKSFVSWKQEKVATRVALIKEGLKYFEQNREQIAKDITSSMGKPIVQAENELNGFFERAYALCDMAHDALSPDIFPKDGDLERQIRHDPLGVVFILAAWNYPLLIAVNGVLTALLAGNTVLLKHSSVTPQIGEHFQNAFGKLGNFEHLLQNVVMDHQLTAETIKSGEIDHVIFTGSVGGGRQIYRAVSETFIDCNLELGGKDGAYVAQDVDVAVAAAGLVDGAMYNAGQSCCGIERVYVHKSKYEEFVNHAKEFACSYQLGDPFDRSTTMGPLFRAKAADYMIKQVEEAKKGGALIMAGGNKIEKEQATFFEPTIITNVTQNSSLIQEENFGPLLPIISVENDEEALKHLRDSRYGLTAAVFTKDKNRAEYFASHLEVGTVFLNRCDYLDPLLPWTGVRESGKGSTLSKYGFLGLTRRKSINFRIIE